MFRKIVILSIAIMAVSGMTLSLSAQMGMGMQGGMHGRGMMGKGNNQNKQMMYDSKTVITFSGEIVAVNSITNLKGQTASNQLRIKSDKEEFTVNLGPVWYMEKESMKFDKGDKVTITGSKVKLNNSDVVIAQKVVKGDKTLELRDENGKPAWKGGKNRNN